MSTVRLYRKGVCATVAENVQPDSLLVLEDGRRIGIQVSVTNTPEAEAAALRALAQSVWKAVLVTSTREKLGAVEELLARDGRPANTCILYVEDVLKDGFSWKQALEGGG